MSILTKPPRAEPDRPKPSIYIIGYGNPGRQDDGLGPALIDALHINQENNELHFPVSLGTNYQLSVEDAQDISAYTHVVFVDACINGEEPYSFKVLNRAEYDTFGSHSLAPESVLTLCETLYDKRPQAYILGIRGYEFDQFEERISEAACNNLLAALEHLKRWLEETSNSYLKQAGV